MLLLRTFGTPGIEGLDGENVGQGAQRRTIALLAILAAAGDTGVRRDKLLELLWPDLEPERGRHALAQALYQAKRSLYGMELFKLAPDDIRLDPGVISSDVSLFESAVLTGNVEQASELYGGPFLDGFVLPGAPEFERWLSVQRAYFARRAAEALNAAAVQAEARGDWNHVVDWLRKLAALEPLSSAIAVRLMQALVVIGDRAGALQHARVHKAVVGAELDTSADVSVLELEEKIRAEGGSWRSTPERGMQTNTADNSDTTATIAPMRVPGKWRVASIVMMCVMLAVGLAWYITSLWSDHRDSNGKGEMYVVAPFRIVGPAGKEGEENEYLSEGVMELIITAMSDVPSVNGSNPGTVPRLWRESGWTPLGGVPFNKAVRLAKQLGGTHLVGGKVVIGSDKLVITGWITDVAKSRVIARATVEGSDDSLSKVIDRLSAQLITMRSGQQLRLANRPFISLASVKSYLAGRSAYRAGQFQAAARNFESAITRDTLFTEAAFWLMLAGNNAKQAERRARGLELAWDSRGNLSASDQRYLEAFAGPRYPKESSQLEHLRAWELVVNRFPNRPEAWQALGEILFHSGRILGIDDWQDRARQAFRRARGLDHQFALPLPYLVQIAALKNDKPALDSLHQYVMTDSSDVGDFIRWCVGIANHDDDLVNKVRTRFETMPMESLFEITRLSQFSAAGRSDAIPAARALVRRSTGPQTQQRALTALHSAGLVSGQPSVVREALDKMSKITGMRRVAHRLYITDAIYAGQSKEDADRAAAALRLYPPSSDTYLDDCVLSQWTLHKNSSVNVRSSVEKLRAQAESSTSDAPLACAELLLAMSAGDIRSDSARNSITLLASMVRNGAPVGEMSNYLPIATAWLLNKMGEQERATIAMRRYPYMIGWPAYTPSR